MEEAICYCNNAKLTIAEIEENISTLKSYLEYNIQKKENEPSIPATGMAVLHQQYVLVEAIQAWIALLKENSQQIRISLI